jgi:GGDEF domain-containing protein
MLKDEVSPGEVIGRTDEAEFAVVLPETGLADAQLLAERVRRKAEWTFGVSFSVAEFPTHAVDAEALLVAARSLLEGSRMGARGWVLGVRL